MGIRPPLKAKKQPISDPLPPREKLLNKKLNKLKKIFKKLNKLKKILKKLNKKLLNNSQINFYTRKLINTIKV